MWRPYWVFFIVFVAGVTVRPIKKLVLLNHSLRLPVRKKNSTHVLIQISWLVGKPTLQGTLGTWARSIYWITKWRDTSHTEFITHPNKERDGKEESEADIDAQQVNICHITQWSSQTEHRVLWRERSSIEKEENTIVTLLIRFTFLDFILTVLRNLQNQ